MPHHVLLPSLKTGISTTASYTCALMDWQWGELRGGTPAILDGDSYISFFHSSIIMPSVHSNGKKIQHYVMGAYRFSARPPFALTHVSPEPIVGKGFYEGKEYPTWKPLRVIFPMGCIVGDEHIWVSYGRQDFEIWVATFDKKKLYASLVPCSSIECDINKYYKRSMNYASDVSARA